LHFVPLPHIDAANQEPEGEGGFRHHDGEHDCRDPCALRNSAANVQNENP
jgi:hypothetical protein